MLRNGPELECLSCHAYGRERLVNMGMLESAWFQEGPEITPVSTARKVLADDKVLGSMTAMRCEGPKAMEVRW